MKNAFFVLFLFILVNLSFETFCSPADTLFAPQLISPPNNSQIISDTLFDWSPVTGASSYYIQFTMGIMVIADSTVSVDSLRMNFTGGPALTNIYWRVKAVNQQGSGPYSEVWRFVVLPAGIQKISEAAPDKFYLNSNYPNPFNNETVIEFGVPPVSNKSSVTTIQVFDVQGKLVETLVNNRLEAGNYNIKWDADRYSSGIYFYRLHSQNFSSTKKMVLIK
jgi:uncharacterized protein YdaL